MNSKHVVQIFIGCLIVFFLLLVVVSSRAYSFPYKDIELKISGAITEMYDDNIDLSRENKREDFITGVILNMDIAHESKRQTLNFSARIEQEIFANRQNLNNLDGDFTLNFQREISHYDKVGLGNTYSSSFEPGTFEDQFGRIESRRRISSNKFNLFYLKDISEHLTGSIKYFNEFNKISGETANLFTGEEAGDSYRNGLNLLTSYTLDSATSISLSYEFSVRRYRISEATATYHTLAASVRDYISKQLYIDGIAGVDFIEMDLTNRNVKDVGGYIKVLLTDEFKNTDVKLSFEKRKDANVFREELFDVWKTDVSLTSQLSKRLASFFSGFYGNGTYESTNVTEKLFGASMGLIYEFSEKLKGDISYSYASRRFGNLEQATGYTRNTVESRLTVTF